LKSQQSRVIPTYEPEPEIESPVTDNGESSLRALEQGQKSIALLSLAWERRKFLGRLTVRGLVLAIVVVLLIPNRYESTTRMMPPESQSGSGLAMLAAVVGGKGAGGPGLASLAGDLLGMKNSGALLADILHSRTVADHIIDRFDLRKVYWDKYWEDARKELGRRTDISEDHKSGVITVTVWDRDPHRAEQIAQAYVQELDRLVAQVSTSAARREREFIEQRLVTVRQDLNDAERQFSDFSSKNTVLDVKEQTKAMVESAALLQAQLIAAESEVQGLEQIYTGNNVRVRTLQARVRELKNQLQKLGGTDASLEPNAAQTNDIYPSIRKLPLLSVEWVNLYRRTKIQEAVFELLTQEYEMARIQEAKETAVIRVIDQANAPEKKSFPPRSLLVVLFTLLSLAAGIAWIWVSVRWQQMDPQDPRKLLALNVWNSASEHGGRLAARLSLNGSRSSLFRRSSDRES
jgi:capsule polysaccharide export protein KpsE/RkpR